MHPFVRTAARLSCAAILSTSFSEHSAAAEDPGIRPLAVGAGPYYFDTAEQHDIRVDILARGLFHAYSLAFLPNADALIVERGTRLRLIRKVTSPKPELVGTALTGIPEAATSDDEDDVVGIQDVALHPDFSKNHLVYYTFNRAAGTDPKTRKLRTKVVLVRARLQGSQLVDSQDLVSGEISHDFGGSRILFGKDNLIYVAVGALSKGDLKSAQRTDNVYGKVLRVRGRWHHPSGQSLRPCQRRPGEIYTVGHRDPLGLTVEPRSGSIISSEHGPQGGDKINRISSGRNYGWPEYTYGTEYAGAPLPTTPIGPHTEPPIMVWIPSIAPSGITFYNGGRFPAWKNNLFVASARRGEIDRTGALVRVVFNDKLQEIRQESLLEGLHQRIRDVRQGPDGLLYVLTDEDNSVLLRISPSADPQQRRSKPL